MSLSLQHHIYPHVPDRSEIYSQKFTVSYDLTAVSPIINQILRFNSSKMLIIKNLKVQVKKRFLLAIRAEGRIFEINLTLFYQ